MQKCWILYKADYYQDDTLQNSFMKKDEHSTKLQFTINRIPKQIQ